MACRVLPQPQNPSGLPSFSRIRISPPDRRLRSGAMHGTSPRIPVRSSRKYEPIRPGDQSLPFRRRAQVGGQVNDLDLTPPRKTGNEGLQYCMGVAAFSSDAAVQDENVGGQKAPGVYSAFRTQVSGGIISLPVGGSGSVPNCRRRAGVDRHPPHNLGRAHGSPLPLHIKSCRDAGARIASPAGFVSSGGSVEVNHTFPV
jgi:hypothetical protein